MPDQLNRPPPASLRARVQSERAARGRHRSGFPGGRTRLERARADLADRLPDTLRGSRVRPSRRAVLGLLAVTIAVAAILGIRLAMASAAARPVPVDTSRARAAPSATGSPALAGATTGPLGSTTAAASGGAVGAVAGPGAAVGATGSVLVHVAGRVRHPGVVRLAAGARVQDAVRAAGGALPGSDLVGINLAEPVADGMQIVVARTGGQSGVNGAGTATSGGAGTGAGQVTVDINTSDVAILDALPGVGPVLAQRIVDWRTSHGRFTSIDELDEVSGIGDKLLADIRPHVRL